MRSSLLPYVKIKFNNGISRRALIDTGACANVISNRLLQEITETDKNAVRLKQTRLYVSQNGWRTTSPNRETGRN